MARQTRRTFLKSTLAASACVVAGTKSSARVLGANERIRIAVAGLNGRGESHVHEFGERKDCEIVYLVDPDRRTYGPRLKQLDALGGGTPQLVQDIRRALDDPSVDAISIATPNHWHALMTIWACQAGKDVYVEKPCCHNVHEGRIAVETARKHGRIVQHGTQSRSNNDWAKVIGAVRSGELGKLKVARGLCYKPRGSIGFKAAGPPPAEVDFNLWLGPAPDQPFHENLVHYNWHWFWDTGNGDIGNQGVHQMDIARWGIPGGVWPKSVISLGGRVGYSDQGETPNTQLAMFDYGATQLIFEVRGLKTDKYRGQDVGNVFHLEAGVIADQTYYPHDSDKPAPLPGEPVERGPGDGQFGNFLAAVRSRRPEDLNAEIEEGYYSAALCHLANVSYRLGTEISGEPRTEALANNAEAGDALERMEEHLRANALKLSDLKLRLGRRLEFDAATERCNADDEANSLLTRNYREPFVVPEKVV